MQVISATAYHFPLALLKDCAKINLCFYKFISNGLAAILYKLLTGKEPESAISRMMGEPLKPPIEINSNISDRVNQAILKGLELQPEKRPQSVHEWLELLKVPEGTNLNPDELLLEVIKLFLPNDNKS
ncbi:serine/threonine kinase [Cylindrospermum sp. NIES-4074]|nr:serine/threonine kinase [Cylindrospermum sp. NIES-4074]